MKSLFTLIVASSILLAAACSKKEAPAPAETGASPAPAEAVATQAPTAAPLPSAAPAGIPAAEEHRVRVTNYAKTPVIVTINNEWVGQWDKDATVPVTMIMKGKNDLLVEAAGDPKSILEVSVDAKRGDKWVTLLSANFNGKPGKHSFAFGAK